MFSIISNGFTVHLFRDFQKSGVLVDKAEVLAYFGYSAPLKGVL